MTVQVKFIFFLLHFVFDIVDIYVRNFKLRKCGPKGTLMYFEYIRIRSIIFQEYKIILSVDTSDHVIFHMHQYL